MSAIVLPHGDLDPDNIAVETQDNEWVVPGLLDWKYSGFIPSITKLPGAPTVWRRR